MGVGSEAVPIRTPAGQAELSTRERRLSQRHRTLLHLIDGRRGEAEIRRMGMQAGVPDSCFGELLAMHLIDVRRPAAAKAVAPTPVVRREVSHQHVALPIGTDWREGVVSDSELPALRTVPPSSGFRDSGSGSPAPSSWFMTDPIDDRGGDDALERAREILLRTVRAEAPVAGSLTSLRLRRARSRDELHALIPEVEARVGKPPRTLSATLAIQQVRTLLAGPRQLAWGSR
jgi:hypothetical protein